MSSDNYSQSPPQFGRIARPKGFLPLNHEVGDANPLATNGKGALIDLIKSRSYTSLGNAGRRPSSIRGRDVSEDEEAAIADVRRRDSDDAQAGEGFKGSEERRLSILLMGPQMRSQRLIGNSNPRYKWGK
jgi:hypothetical protein